VNPERERPAASGALPLVVANGLSKTFQTRRGGPVRAVRDVSFTLSQGESLGIFGESGSGKSTVSRLVLGLQRPDTGSVTFRGADISQLSGVQMRDLRRYFGAVFQEPFESLDSLWSVRRLVGESLTIHEPHLDREARETRIVASLRLAGLDETVLDRLPRQLSGGQQQRVGIARAIVLRPPLLVLDEPTSSLDVSVRYQILATLARLRRDEGLTYLLISHDLPTIRSVCNRVAVLHKGSIVEEGATSAVLDDPQHEYTQKLVRAQVLLPDSASRVPRP